MIQPIEDSGRDSELPRKFASHFYYQSHNVDDAEHYAVIGTFASILLSKSRKCD